MLKSKREVSLKFRQSISPKKQIIEARVEGDLKEGFLTNKNEISHSLNAAGEIKENQGGEFSDELERNDLVGAIVTLNERTGRNEHSP